MERERAQSIAVTISNGLLVAAAVVFVLGTIAIAIILDDVGELFPGQGLSFPDYVRVLMGYAPTLIVATAILAAAGFYFRWLAAEQDAKMVEFDMLLDALGVPAQDEDPLAEPKEEPPPDA